MVRTLLTSIRNEIYIVGKIGTGLFLPSVLTGKNVTCPVFPPMLNELDEFGLRLALKRAGAKKEISKKRISLASGTAESRPNVSVFVAIVIAFIALIIVDFDGLFSLQG